MRKTFIETLTRLARTDWRIVLLTGDLGFMVIEPFAEEHPDRFFNVGVAEQDMTGIATGLAEAGYVPFAYSIATFATLRPFEFIRNGPVLHGYPVRIVGVGGGFEYGHAGPTHHAIEDVAVMRSQPGMTIVAPADHAQAASALESTWDLPGPVYYRLGKDEKLVIPGLDGRFCLRRADVVREGNGLALIAMGAIARETYRAADLLSEVGIEATVVVVASMAPAPIEDLAEVLVHHRLAITVEAHTINGGLGSLVSEVVAERGLGCKVVRCGIRAHAHVLGSERYLNDQQGISAERLAWTAREALVAV